ncbi:MAG: metal-dependent hydrolase [Gammaproteobacteria bacterium]|nr:metal-dependent hydrolase [Gammaproteobacteria bacterium]MBU2237911.1 metal-dependent hydrolase [Gammaproteobacteria bacterium]MBU2321302.1 metal-dependent hydrolase [Gammaproteobacteria bacterium]MBU2414972.1 metal-dependent hydrolase [Gammaproteobacteria bacterium]
MADFKTHVTVAAILSTPLAASTFIMGFANMNEAIFYALAGTLGGLLPDIDADDSAAIRLVFRLFGALVAGLAIAFGMDKLLHWQILALAIVSYLIVRFPIQWGFEQFTIHRGTLHSLLANIMFAILAVPAAYHLFALPAKTAWGIGVFVFLGATIHLVLDELYSIELSGMRIKRSFGTAMKITDWGEPLASILLVVGCVVGYWLSPSAEAWLDAFAWWPESERLAEWIKQGLNEFNHLWS